MNLLCPACHTPLPAAVAVSVVTCPTCSAEVDVTRAGTAVGRPRYVPEIDRAGTTAGDFRIQARIGGGGMGTVYRATDAAGRAVAVKFLSPALADTPEIVARFAREAGLLARLEHPAIVRVLAHGTEESAPWFAMELVDGRDLKTRLAEGPLGPDETEAIFGRVFAALHHAHERGVVHRDLKPANVLLAADGAKLADFGVARWDAEALTGALAATRLTETAAVLGTLSYMSPEQRRGGDVDRRSDLFSAGVMLYEAATGVVPQGAFAPPSQLNRRYRRAFDQLVMRLLNPEPARRPATAAEAAQTLARALGSRKAVRLVIAGAAAGAVTVAVLVATLGGWATMREGRSPKLVDTFVETTEPAARETKPTLRRAPRVETQAVSAAPALPAPSALGAPPDPDAPAGVAIPNGNAAEPAAEPQQAPLGDIPPPVAGTSSKTFYPSLKVKTKVRALQRGPVRDVSKARASGGKSKGGPKLDDAVSKKLGKKDASLLDDGPFPERK